MKRRLRIAVKDISLDAINNLLTWLGEVYLIEITEQDPDFVIHSCFGYEHLKYSGVRVAWLGENIHPDFNVSDYAMGFGRIAFSDRYKRIPLYRWYFSDYESLFDADRAVIKINARDEQLTKSRFCTIVVSNGGRGTYFENFYCALSNYKRIDSGGRHNNNVGGPVVDKQKFIREGKFHLAFENSSSPGYVTEKIMHAFAAHTIPIYWGAPDIVQDFNPKAFVNCHAYQSIDEVVAEIRRLDQDTCAYVTMLQEPLFANGKEPTSLGKREIMSWLTQMFDQPRENAYRRNRQYWGARYERDHYGAFFQPHIQMAKLGYRAIRKRLLRKD